MWFCRTKVASKQPSPARQVPSAISWSRFSSPQIAHGQPILCWWSNGLEIPEGAADGAIQLGSMRIGGTPHRMFLLSFFVQQPATLLQCQLSNCWRFESHSTKALNISAMAHCANSMGTFCWHSLR